MTTSDSLVLGKLAKYNIYPLSPLDRVIYKYVSYDTAIKIIESSTIKFSSPNSFNDPFEFTLDLLDTKWTKADLKTFLDNRNDLTKYQKKQLFNDSLNQLSNLKKLTDDLLTKDKEKIGISCFSLSYKKTLMWSHYADKHGGICLGFRLPSFMHNANFFMLRVSYVNSLKSISYHEEREIALIYWSFTKSQIWEYEEEVRAMFIDQIGLIPFDKECLKEIYFGLKVDSKQKNEFIEKLKKNNYDLKQTGEMKMNKKSFDIIMNTIKI